MFKNVQLTLPHVSKFRNISGKCKILLFFYTLSDKYAINEMAFLWRKEHPLTFPNDFGENGFRLPKYVVSIPGLYFKCDHNSITQLLLINQYFPHSGFILHIGRTSDDQLRWRW